MLTEDSHILRCLRETTKGMRILGNTITGSIIVITTLPSCSPLSTLFFCKPTVCSARTRFFSHMCSYCSYILHFHQTKQFSRTANSLLAIISVPVNLSFTWKSNCSSMSMNLGFEKVDDEVMCSSWDSSSLISGTPETVQRKKN